MATQTAIPMCLAEPGHVVHARVPTATVTEEKSKKIQKRTLLRLGISGIVFGGISMVTAIVGVSVCASNIHNCGRVYHYGSVVGLQLTFASPGIWCGASLVITGILGICTKHSSTHCMLDANLAMGIVSLLLSLVLLALTLTASIVSIGLTTVLVVNILLIFTGLAGLIISVLHVSNSCLGSSLKKRPQQEGAMSLSQQSAALQQSQQYVQLQNGQLGIIQGQPMGQAYPMVGTPAPVMQHATPAQPPVNHSVVQLPNGQLAFVQTIQQAQPYPMAHIPTQIAQPMGQAYPTVPMATPSTQPIAQVYPTGRMAMPTAQRDQQHVTSTTGQGVTQPLADVTEADLEENTPKQQTTDDGKEATTNSSPPSYSAE